MKPFTRLCSTKNTSTHQHLQRNTTTAWYETRNDLTSTCDTNDQAKQCNSTRHVINKRINQCRRRQPLASKPSQWLESLFQTPTPLLFQNFWIRIWLFFKFENPTPVQTPAAIIDLTVIHSCFYIRNDRSNSCQCCSGSGFLENFLDPDPDWISFLLKPDTDYPKRYAWSTLYFFTFWFFPAKFFW